MPCAHDGGCGLPQLVATEIAEITNNAEVDVLGREVLGGKGPSHECDLGRVTHTSLGAD